MATGADVRIAEYNSLAFLQLQMFRYHKIELRPTATRQQLAYKCSAAGVELVVADRFYASSQTCSGCGNKRQIRLTLKDRTFNCPTCRLSIDRDTNAAINLDRYQDPIKPTPPNTGSRKTYAIDLRKTFPQGKAGSPEGVNINPKQTTNRGSLPELKGLTVVI